MPRKRVRSLQPDIGPAIVAGMVGEAGRLLRRIAYFPQIVLVVGQVMVVPALGRSPDQVVPLGRKPGEILVRTPSRQVHEHYTLPVDGPASDLPVGPVGLELE